MRRNPHLKGSIFLCCLAVALVTAILCTGIFLGVFGNGLQRQSRENLMTALGYLSWGVELEGTDYLDGIQLDPDSRVTWIAPDGAVLYDSRLSPEQMDNHRQREEVAEALDHGYGESIRRSDSMETRTCNYAVRIDDGSVVRFSVQQIWGGTLLKDAFPVVLAALALVGLMALLVAAWVSSRIVGPINRIDLQNPKESFVYTELEPLVERIDAQNLQLQEQFEHLKEEHERQDNFRREFTANVSHELKTPLTSISGFAEIIRDGLVRSEDIPRFAGNIYREAQRLITLVGDIIKISQMEEKQLTMEREPLDLEQLCSEVLHRLTSAAERNQVRLALQAEEQLPTVPGIRQVAEDMIYNLCDNAIKYNRPEGTVTVRIYKDGEQISVAVRDTGIGIPEAQQQRVFERFYRVDRDRSRKIGGTGLGLSIVKHGALYHGASLSLTSTPGKGTTITVSFPQTSPENP